MYAVIVENEGKLEWYGAYDDRDGAEAKAEELGGKVVILYHPLYKEPGDYYGTERS